MTEAAHNLGVQQSALTAQIHRLDRDPGQPLLKRAERGMARF
ncbi:LysR family transcriptional regulator [Streptomyces sp. NPDC006368]